ncbi:MAG: ATP-binding cassette domain-containing protein [Erysipelotrichaceae bacterium]|nr:ATP-binding cassette domain-containing protein [Erysipelotrichaceae bacterium]
MKLCNINKTYHNKNNTVVVFKNLNLELPTHGCITIYGESGSGKTTLFELIAGIDKDYEGTVENDKRVEYLFQEIELFENLSVCDNLLFATSDHNEINELLKKFDMTDLIHQKVKKLSNGEKRRVQIMRSLLNHPDLLLMDEPSASLDQKNAALICDMIKQLSHEITVVITTHDEALFDNVADISYRIEYQQLTLIKQNHRSQAVKKEAENKKESVQTKENSLKMSLLYLKAHKLNFLVSIILLIMFSFAAYTGFYYNDSGGEKQRHNVWNYSTNLIYTFPNVCESTPAKNSNYVYKECESYDLFTLEYLNKVIEKNNDIIAYALEWDSGIYNGIDYESMEQLEKDVAAGKPISIVDRLKRSFYSYYDVFQIIEYVDGEETIANFVNPETTYVDIKGLRKQLEELNETPRVFPYELVQEDKLPLIVGKYPEKNTEVIIADELAQALQKIYGYDSLNKLIGTQLTFYTRGDVDELMELLTDDWGNKDLYLHVTISGITSYENMFENRMYFKRNGFQSTLADIYHYDVNKLKVHGEKFLIDPSIDTQSVLDDLNVNSPLVNDSYHIFNGENNVYVEWSGKINQDQSLMKKLILVLLVICLLFILLQRFFFKKQLIKEAHIMKQCAYSPIKIECIVNLFICICAGVLSFLMLIGMIPALNQIALLLFNRTILDWSIEHYIYSLLFVVIVYELGMMLYLKYLTRG